MTNAELNRRAFLRAGGDAMKASVIALSFPAVLTACGRAQQARLLGEGFTSLSTDEAREYDAIAARIIPTDDTPGAREAGAVYFIDYVISDAFEGQKQQLRSGLEDLQAKAASLYGKTQFADLTPVQQDSLLTQSEGTNFFATIRFLIIAAMFSLPEYGGNKDKIGWQLIGFEDRHAWTQPYGFYDSEYLEKGE
ncbi:MAG: gluconate 2-dehydrogenase subunit 3 family protein [Proteobacteria bacterium]|nr:gluconate 2-dehydrogenase subunit 3 family protein [Pseudomonadota bacterium]MDA0895927.1 gluconate 2-dehydrogenase subunit 3 family protein [Pseudomonadota bacterium]MDA1244072.1 gluconate 2-dehydrogenase subunit 3 family protein [Pseudomonadota bacterium]